jgi:glycine cleavage system aminomethyltransferase T
MNENYESLHKIDMNKVDIKHDPQLRFTPFVPYLPAAQPYVGGRLLMNSWGIATPVWYSGWRDETLSWHQTCSLSAVLNPTSATIIKGPDAKKFLKENFVNNVDNFPIGIIKHGLLCLDNGLLATHGVLMHTAEDTYEAHWHAPYINYLFSKKNYNAELIDISLKQYIFQLQGPRCLEILEKVTGDDLHDIAYRHFRMSQIDGHAVRILRFGMAGTLGYEVHGEAEYARDHYKKILETGQSYGIRPIAWFSYNMNHIEGGFPQLYEHFVSAMSLNEDFVEYLKKTPYTGGNTYNTSTEGIEFLGSVGPDPHNYMYNPFELGLGRCINWNHEFPGKAALQKIKDTQDIDTVMLKWNVEDLCKIYASQFVPGEDYYKQMDLPADSASVALFGHFLFSTDQVFDENGNKLGRSYGRIYSHYYRAMLSFGALSAKGRELGKEVYILWGEPGTKQMKVRATVERFPYNDHLVNDGFDVETIPHPVFDR